MEFMQLQVKVLTLNKNLFKQLEVTDMAAHPSVPLIHGWVECEGTWFIVQGYNGLERLRRTDLFSRWYENNHERYKDKTMDEKHRLFDDYQHKHPHIFV